MSFFEKLIEKSIKEEIEKKIVGGVILNAKNEILLLKRPMDDFMGGIYELPSGNLEENESIEEGLIREIKEETNLEILNIESFINTFDYLSGSGKKSRQFNFEIKVKKYDDISLTEHDEYIWLSLSDIENNENITEEVKYTIDILIYNKFGDKNEF